MGRIAATLAGVAVTLSVSCFSRVPDQRYAQRVAQIDVQYGDGVAAIERRFQAEIEESTQFEAHLIAVETTSGLRPAQPVSLRPDLTRLLAMCDELRTRAISTGSEIAASTYKECNAKHSEFLVAALVATYWGADVIWIAKILKDSQDEVDLESAFVYSHNLRVRAYIVDRRERALTAKGEALRELEAARADAIAVARHERDLEVDANRRVFAATLAAAARSMGQNARTTAPTPVAPAATTFASKGCTSDFSCGIGHRCVKNNYSGQGFCAKAVDQFGTPTFDLPSTESVLAKVPGDADCHFDTECPIGFRCDLQSGACLR
jgi:hypothetical protein